MPKMKTKKSVSKRISKTGTGKLKCHKAYKGKSAKCERQLKKRTILSKGDTKRLEALIAYKQEVILVPRVKGSVATRARRKKILKLAKGYFGSKRSLFRTARQAVMKSLMYAYRDRRQRKRDFRRLWIVRINAATRLSGLSYSKFMHGLKLAGVDVNRKMLAELACTDLPAFNELVEVSKGELVT